MEHRQYFTMDNKNIGLVSAHQVLELAESPQKSADLSVVIGEQSDYYGLVVDRFLGEHDLVVRPLDHRLGKVQDISAAALMGDGSPILIVDVSDLIHSVDNLLNGNQLSRFDKQNMNATLESRKSILVVDDSITVREMERKLLENKGYKVDVAVDGMEGWYTVCTPVLGVNGNPESAQVLLTKITTIRKLIGKSISTTKSKTVLQNSQSRLSAMATPTTGIASSHPNLVVIGSSTGGPNALAAILSRL